MAGRKNGDRKTAVFSSLQTFTSGGLTKRHVVKHGLDLGLDWTCKTWTGLVKHGLVKHGLVKHGNILLMSVMGFSPFPLGPIETIRCEIFFA